MAFNLIAFLFLFVVLAVIITGTVLGWVSAKRIRESDGALHGMGFAATAALPLPMILAAVFLFLIMALIFRVIAISEDVQISWLMVMIPVLTTIFILLVKLFGTLLNSVKTGEPIIAGFLSRMNRVTVITLILIWLVFGGIVVAGFLKTETLPKSSLKTVDEASASEVGDGPASASFEAQAGVSFQPEHEMTIGSTANGSRTLFGPNFGGCVVFRTREGGVGSRVLIVKALFGLPRSRRL